MWKAAERTLASFYSSWFRVAGRKVKLRWFMASCGRLQIALWSHPSFCFFVAGHKVKLRWFRQYVVAVLTVPGQLDAPPTCALQVFDLRNKLIASSITLAQVRCYILTAYMLAVHGHEVAPAPHCQLAAASCCHFGWI